MILMHAPSGFGKSTLAAQWREELSSEGVAVAWLTIDDDDNNEVWFLAHLLESIRRVRPALAESLGQVLEDHGDDASRYVLTSLIDEIHEKDDRIALVKEDWHRVSDTQTSASLGFLLDHGCHHLQVSLPCNGSRDLSVLHHVGGAALWVDDRPERRRLPSQVANGVDHGDDQWDEHRGDREHHERDKGEIGRHGFARHFSA